jgi:hypothetical protein
VKHSNACRAFLLLSLVVLAGCASTLKVTIESQASTNDARPFYFVARSTDAQQFLSEEYEVAADRMFKHPPDPSISYTETLFPGRPTSVRFPTKPDTDVILYFFFTSPGPKWKVPLNRPIPSEVVVELGRNQINRVLVRKR